MPTNAYYRTRARNNGITKHQKLLTGKPPGAGGAISNERYAQFVSWSKKLADYYRVDEDASAAAKEDEGINEEGVAVVFDESEEEQRRR